MKNPDVDKLRRKVEYNRGVRKIQAESDLVEILAQIDNKEAVEIGTASAERARALLDKAQERGKHTTEYERLLASALRSLAYAVLPSKRFNYVANLLDESMQLFKQADDVPGLIKCYEFRCILYRDQDRFDEALCELERALELGDRKQYAGRMPRIHLALGNLYRTLHKYDKSVQSLETGLRVAREVNDTQTEIILLSESARTQYENGKLSVALEFFNEAVALERREQILDKWNSVSLLYELAQLSMYMGKLDVAVEYYAQAIMAAEQANFARLLPMYLSAKSSVHLSRAEYLTALECLQRALRVYRKAGDTASLAWSLAKVGAVFNGAGDTEIAREYFAKANDFLEQAEEHVHLEHSYFLVTVLILASQRYDGLNVEKYREFFADYIAKIPADNGPSKKMPVYLSYAFLLADSGRIDAACEVFTHLLDWSRRFGFRFNEGRVAFALGELHHGAGEYDKAKPHLLNALEITRSIGAKSSLRRIYAVLDQICDQLGDKDAAAQYREQFRLLQGEYLSEEVHLQLQLWHERFVKQEILRENERLQSALSSMETDKVGLQRLLESKDARIAHMADSLKQVSRQLRQRAVAGQHSSDMENMSKNIEASIADQNWSEFEANVQDQDEEFIARLAKMFPRLTVSERKVCALMRLNHSTKELSQMLNITPRSVQAYRHRIRKKLSIPPTADINAGILALLYPNEEK